MKIGKLLQGLELDEQTKEAIETIVKIFNKRNSSLREKEMAARMVDQVLESLFKTQYTFVIPASFLNTELGNILFEVKYSSQYLYSTSDAVILCGITKTNVYHNRDTGSLKMIRRGSNYLVTENELKTFMKHKGMTEKEIGDRLEVFWELRNENYLKKIEKEACVEEFKKRLEKR